VLATDILFFFALIGLKLGTNIFKVTSLFVEWHINYISGRNEL
jgi:hypothetical protein